MDQAENKFNKLFGEAGKPLDSSIARRNEKLTSDLNDAFRTLSELYVRENEWSKFFDLVDLIEQAVWKVPKANVACFHLDELLRLIGDIFYSVNYRPTAFEFYKKSIGLSEQTNVFAIESLENLIDECMERWHYRMINDSVRNRAYSMAIFKRLEQLRHEIPAGRDIRVLDIGSGTGLLSALCLSISFNFSARNVKIYACEENEFFYNISRRFLKSIDNSNLVKIINKNSHELDIKEDLDGGKVDLIVTEIFDDGLLGEGCLTTFYDALFTKKLAHPTSSTRLSSRLITQSARIFICAVESSRLRRSSRYSYEAGRRIDARCLNNSERFENEFDSSELNFEPYTSENLNYLDDLESLSQPEEIVEFRIGFDDEKLLEKLCKLNETIKAKKHLKITRSGTLDAIVFWFELYLDDDIILTNCPIQWKKSKNAQICRCWDQAVFNVSKPVNVCEGNLIGVDCKLRCDCIMVNLSEKKAQVEIQNDDNLVLWLSEFEIRLLNNRSYQEFYTGWFENELTNMTRSESRRDLTVGYLANSFSDIFFSLVLNYSQALESQNIQLKVEVFVNLDQDFAKYFASTVQENFPDVKMHFLNQLDTEQHYHLDYLIIEPIDVKFGVLKKHLISELLLIKSCNSNKELKMFPTRIQLKSTMIESDSLLKDCRLTTNKNLCIDNFDNIDNVDLEPFLIDFYTSHQYSLNINYNAPNYKQLTEIVKVLELDLTRLETAEQDVQGLQAKAMQSGRIDFVLYWYEIGADERSYSPVRESHLEDKDTFWNQLIAFSLFGKRKEIELDQHDLVKFDFAFKNQMFIVRNVTPSK